MVASCTPPTGDLTHSPGMCPDLESNRRPFGSQVSAQSTEPHQPGLETVYFTFSCPSCFLHRLHWTVYEQSFYEKFSNNGSFPRTMIFPLSCAEEGKYNSRAHEFHSLKREMHTLAHAAPFPQRNLWYFYSVHDIAFLQSSHNHPHLKYKNTLCHIDAHLFYTCHHGHICYLHYGFLWQN